MAIRDATPADAAEIAAIYAHHVLHGTATFDTVPPDAGWWRTRIAELVATGAPFLVAAGGGGAVVGYAYAARFRDRPAYAHTCENSIYVAAGRTGEGIGSRLLGALVDAARARGFEHMIAVVGGAEPASVALHAKAGFVEAGRLRGVGRKFGRALDTLYMQRDLRA
ncbi:MAG: N-acetyltransferase family protein [Cypionkella sp.]